MLIESLWVSLNYYSYSEDQHNGHNMKPNCQLGRKFAWNTIKPMESLCLLGRFPGRPLQFVTEFTILYLSVQL
jgi:hypothetical protein